HRDHGLPRRGGRWRLECASPGRARAPRAADREQGAQATRARRTRDLGARHPWRLSPGAPRGGDHGRRHRGRDGRPDRHDRMQRACRSLRPRIALRRARELAAHQQGRGRRARRRHPGRHGQATRGVPRHEDPVAHLAGLTRHLSESTTNPMAIERSDIETRLREPAESSSRSRDASAEVANAEIVAAFNRRYAAGFVTDIETDSLPPGLDEDVVRWISRRKGEPDWMTEWRVGAYRHWLTMTPPQWAKLDIAPIDFQAISYFAAPKQGPKSLAEVDPKLLETYDKLGVPLHERAKLAGVAVDAVFDSVSVGTTFRKELADAGVLFCSMSEAIREYPEIVRRYIGSVVPSGDNYFAALNSAVFSDGSFVFVPKGVRCPMELSTYFRINAGHTGQFERTLIICEDRAEVSYLEGCT